MKSWLNAAYDRIIDEHYSYRAELKLAGSGPLSDGIPRSVGDGGDSEREMPDPPKASKRISSLGADDTQPMRKP